MDTALFHRDQQTKCPTSMFPAGMIPHNTCWKLRTVFMKVWIHFSNLLEYSNSCQYSTSIMNELMMVNTTDGMVEYFLYCIVYSMHTEIHIYCSADISCSWYGIWLVSSLVVWSYTTPNKYISNTLNDKKCCG